MMPTEIELDLTPLPMVVYELICPLCQNTLRYMGISDAGKNHYIHDAISLSQNCKNEGKKFYVVNPSTVGRLR